MKSMPDGWASISRWSWITGAGCEGAQFCKFKANNAITGGRTGRDPCKDMNKHAIIKYHCEEIKGHQVEEVSEHEETDVSCPVGETISIHHPVIFESPDCNENPLEQGKAYEAVNKE